MAKFKYRTDERKVVFGFVFANGEYTEVPDANEVACRKLRGNPEFTQGRAKKTAKKPAKKKAD